MVQRAEYGQLVETSSLYPTEQSALRFAHWGVPGVALVHVFDPNRRLIAEIEQEGRKRMPKNAICRCPCLRDDKAEVVKFEFKRKGGKWVHKTCGYPTTNRSAAWQTSPNQQ